MTRLEQLLVASLVLVVLLVLVTGKDPSHRNLEFLPDMARTPAYESQSKNPVFLDGKTQQPPPEGTVARGYLPLMSRGLLLDTTTAWEELPPEQLQAWRALVPPWDRNNLPEEERVRIVARGKEVFANFCTPCHGAGANGDGLVTQRGVPPPPSLLVPASKEFSDGRMMRAITAGKGNMASYRAQVERDDRWKVITYIRTLQKTP
jgi:mono/diheme cytochrome c family protein